MKRPRFLTLDCVQDVCHRPYLVRLIFLNLFGWSLRLHIFLRSDEDRELHDHPWGYWSWLICGNYDEVIPSPCGRAEQITVHRKRWSLKFRQAHWRHRVILPLEPTAQGSEDGAFSNYVATIVLTTPKSREWGFWRGGKFIHWKQFTSNMEC